MADQEGKQGTLTYAGIHAEGEFSVVRTGSAIPDPITAKFPLGAKLPEYGDIVIQYGTDRRDRRVLRNCRLAQETIAGAGGAGRWREAVFEDRRWMWRIPKIFVEINNERAWFTYSHDAPNRRSVGSFWEVYPLADFNLVDLLKWMLFEVLGEPTANLRLLEGVPNITTQYPEVVSDGELLIDHLENILEQHGLMLSLNWDDQAYLYPIGVGRDLPNQSDTKVMDFTQSREPAVIPEVLYVLSAKVVFESDFPLIAVGIQPNGKIVDINQLSYKPAGGWARCDPSTMAQVDPQYRELAKQCVWKMYSIPTNNQPYNGVAPWYYDMKFKKPRFYPIRRRVRGRRWTGMFSDVPFVGNKLSGALPLNSRRSYITSSNGPAQIIGYFCENTTTRRNNQDPPDPGAVKPWRDYHKTWELQNGFLSPPQRLIYSDGFSLDEEVGLVTFSRPMYVVNRVNGAIQKDTYRPAWIVLRTSHHLREHERNGFIRAVYEYRTNHPKAVRGLWKTVVADDLPYEVSNVFETDATEFRAGAEFFAQQEMRSYLLNGQAASFPSKGFRFDYGCDGRVRSVRLDRDGEGRCTTVVDWQTNNNIDRLTYDEKLKEMRQRANEAKVKQWQKTLAAQAKMQRRKNKVQ